LEKKQNNWQTLCKFTYISDFGIACKLSCHFVVNPIEIIFSVILLWIQRLWNGLWRLSIGIVVSFRNLLTVTLTA